MTREQMIQALLADWRSTLKEDSSAADTVLELGFIGFRHMLDDELRKQSEDEGLLYKGEPQ
jgi:hypothetical protein